MDAGEGKDDSSLPPGYVSLAMLKERWMQEQRRTPEEKNLRGEKEEKEGERGTASGFPKESLGQRELKNERDQKMAGGSLRDHPPQWRVKNGGRERGLIEVKEKGKAIVVGGSETGDANRTEKKKKKKKWGARKKKSEENGEIEDGEGDEKTNGVRSDEVEIVPRDYVKVGTEGVLSGKTNGSDQICGTLKGVQGAEIAPTGAVTLPRNFEGEGQQIPNAKGRGHGGGFRGNKGGRGRPWKKRNNRVLGGRGENELKEAGVNSGLEKKVEGEKGCDENQRGEKNSIERDGFHSVEDEVDTVKVNEVKLDTENKAEDEISEVTNALKSLNGRDGNGLRRSGNGGSRWGSTGRKFHSPTSGDGKVGHSRSREVSDERDDSHSVEDEVEVLKVNEVKPDSEDKAEYEISEVTNGLRALNGRDGNALRRYGNESWRGGSVGRKFWSPTIGDGKVGYAKSRVESSGGYNRRNANSSRVGRVWVKKGEGLGDAAAENGSSGISVDEQ